MNRFHFSLSRKKLVIIGLILVLVVAIPLTVFVVQQQQQTQGRATPSTTMAVAGPATAAIGDTVSYSVNVTPGSNWVSEIDLHVKYDSTKLEAVDKGFTLNTDLKNIQGVTRFGLLGDPTVDKDKGVISAVISAGSETDAIKCDNPSSCTPTTIGTISFKVLDSPAGQTEVSIIKDPADPNNTLVKSVAGNPTCNPGDPGCDSAAENVLNFVTPAQLTIEGEGTPTPTPTGTATPTPSPTASPTTSPTASPTTSPTASPTTGAPVCASLGTTTSEGTAPLDVILTANGTDSGGTVSKISFTFGDTQTTDLTQGGGIGTDTVNAQTTHTYAAAGAYTASAVLTDDSSLTSTACTTTITVTAAAGTQTIAEATATPAPLPATGPGETIIGVGVLGAILSGLGVLLFLVL